MRDNIFRWINRISTQKPWRILGIFLVFTVLMGFLASRLKIEMTWYSLVPSNHPTLKSYKLIVDKMGNEGGIIVSVENPIPESLVSIANEVVDSVSKLKELVKNVTLKEPEGFFRRHGFMLLDTTILKKSSEMLVSANLDSFLLKFNDNLEGEYIENEENLETQEFDVSMSLTALEDFIYGTKKYLEKRKQDFFSLGTKELITGPLYFKSLDNKKILISIMPSMNISELGKLNLSVNKIRDIIKRIERGHKNTKIMDTGIYSIMRDEYYTGMKDMNISTILSLVLVMALFIIGFRLIQAPFLAAIPLLFGIIWDLGIVYLLIGRLNMMTAFVGVILIGLGIDYSIHIFQASTEEGGIQNVLEKIGAGLLTGAFTTAAAFFSLYFTSFEVLQELGVVIGVGVITTVTATIFTLPSLLTIFGKRIEGKNLSSPLLGKFAVSIQRKGLFIPIILIVLLALSPLAIRRIKITVNPIKLEAKGLASVAAQDTIVKSFGMSTDYIMIPTPNTGVSDSIAKLVKKIPGVSFVNGIHLYLPPMDLQKKRAKYIEKIHRRAGRMKLSKINKTLLLSQLERLNENIIELKSISYMGGIDRIYNQCEDIIKNGALEDLIHTVKKKDDKSLNELNSTFYSIFKPLVISASSSSFLSLKDIPDDIIERYVAKDKSFYLLNVYTKQSIWSDIKKGQVMDRILKISNATGTSVLMRVLWQEGKKQSKKAIIIVFITIFLILLLDFRNIKTAILAYLPVIFAFFFTFGMMGILGVHLNFLNVLALPLIIGIGIDDAVHIIHRYKKQPSVHIVFTLIGRAILYTSLTTIAAFGSLLVCKYKGYPSFGAVVVIGVALAFIMTVTLLPPLLRYVKKDKKD